VLLSECLERFITFPVRVSQKFVHLNKFLIGHYIKYDIM